jgi:hypothetical protein
MPRKNNKIRDYVLPAFGITGLGPAYLNYKSEYPVLAIYQREGSLRRTQINPRLFAGETFFLISDLEGKFQWISPGDCLLSGSAWSPNDYPDDQDKLIWYRRKTSVEEPGDMIIPVRPFSITNVNMDGFDSSRGYPVLAIDMEKVWQENQEQTEAEAESPGKQVAMAFFLVADNDGNFAWIAEDECSLYPLGSES